MDEVDRAQSPVWVCSVVPGLIMVVLIIIAILVAVIGGHAVPLDESN